MKTLLHHKVIGLAMVSLFFTVAMHAQLISWTTPGTGNTVSEDGKIKVAGGPNSKIAGISESKLFYDLNWFSSGTLHQGATTVGVKSLAFSSDYSDARFEAYLVTNAETSIRIGKVSCPLRIVVAGPMTTSKITYFISDADGSNPQPEVQISTKTFSDALTNGYETGIELTDSIVVSSNKRITFKNYFFMEKNTATGATGSLMITKFEIFGISNEPILPEPATKVADFKAEITASNGIKLTWTDLNDAQGYLIRTRSALPVDGKAYAPLQGLDYIVLQGVGEVTIPQTCENTTYNCFIYPFNNAGDKTNYKTNDVAKVSIKTPTEENVITKTIAQVIADSVTGVPVWIRGYVVGYVSEATTPAVATVQLVEGDLVNPLANAFQTLILADDKAESDFSKTLVVKLADGFLREKTNFIAHFDTIYVKRQLMSFKGIYSSGYLVKSLSVRGFENTTSYYFGDRQNLPSRVESKMFGSLNVYSIDKTICIENIPLGSSVTVYNMSGNKIKHMTNLDPSSRISVPQSGFYILKLNKGNDQISFKVVVN